MGVVLLLGVVVVLLIAGQHGHTTHNAPAPKQLPTPNTDVVTTSIPDSADFRADVADGVEDTEIDWWRDNATIWHQQVEGYSGEYSVDGGDAVHTLREGLDDAGAQARHYRQMYTPASKVKLSNMTKQVLEDAHRLLSFTVDWANYRRRDSEKLIDDDHTAQDWATGVSVVGKAIAAFVPVFGVAEGYLSSVQNAIGVGSNAYNQAQAEQQKEVAKALAALTVDQKQYLKARLSCPAAPKYQRRTDPATNDPYLEDAPHINSLEYSTDANSSDAKAVYLGLQTRLWSGPNGEQYYSRNALFYPLIFHPASGYNAEVWGAVNRGENVDHWDSGCACVVHALSQDDLDSKVDLYSEPRSYLRWSCAQLLGQNRNDESLAGMKARTVRRAYAYRALDLLACLLFPEDAFHAHLYYYRNPVFGEIRGSIFPPTEEDLIIKNPDIDLNVSAVSAGQDPVIHTAIDTVATPVSLGIGSRFSKLV